MVVKGCFRFFYNLYNTSIGRCLHNCMIKNRHFRRIRSGQHLDHSNIDREFIEFPSIRLKIVPLAKTNYSYFLQDIPSGTLAVIDPGDADYLSYIADSLFRQPISFAFITHKHWDHSAGVQALKEKYPGLRVIAHTKEKIDDATERLNDRDFVKVGTTTVTVLHTPGHTEGAVCYYVFQEEYQPILFTGDTLFLGGMGAFFEGSARAILSTIDKIKTLPDETLIFPGHEYSEYTLKFARYIDSKNSSALAKEWWLFGAQPILLHHSDDTEGRKVVQPIPASEHRRRARTDTDSHRARRPPRTDASTDHQARRVQENLPLRCPVLVTFLITWTDSTRRRSSLSCTGLSQSGGQSRPATHSHSLR